MPTTNAPLIAIAPLPSEDARDRPLVAAREPYVSALRDAGALIVVLAGVDRASAAAYLARCDGLLLPGGRDLNPRLYGEEPDPSVQALDGAVGETYLELARVALRTRLPTLGICLGAQVMNVALGGSLVQDLAQDRGVTHRADGGAGRHAVAIREGSRLAAAVAALQPEIVSDHHQGVRALGAGLVAVARAEDGVVEAIEHIEHDFFIGVQWHPEMNRSDRESRSLFAAFVAAAARGARSR